MKIIRLSNIIGGYMVYEPSPQHILMVEFVKKNTWVVLVAAFVVLVVAGIAMS